MSGVRGFCDYIPQQKPYILVSFGQNINFKQRTELTDRRRAENKSQEKQGFHLDAGQFVGALLCTSAVKLSCRGNDGADGNRTLWLALLTALIAKKCNSRPIRLFLLLCLSLSVIQIRNTTSVVFSYSDLCIGTCSENTYHF